MTAGPSVACRPVPSVWIFASASGRFLSVLACQPVGRGPLVPWILAIARNRALDALRRRRRWWRKAERWEQAHVAGQDAAAPAGPAESSVPGWPLHREVHAALAALPEEQRRVVLLAYF